MKKKNKTFMQLSAIGIIMVVDAHSGVAFKHDPLYLLESILPYNVFFMQMFVFISGYFLHIGDDIQTLPNDKTGGYILNYIRKKIKRLILPYYAWMIFFGIIWTILNKLKLAYYDGIFLDGNTFLEAMIDTLISGHPLSVCFAMWFVMALFVSLLFYLIIRISFKKIWNDWVAYLAFLILAIIVVSFSVKSEYKYNNFQLIFKGIYFLQYLQLGQLFNKYLESVIIHISQKIKGIILICIALLCVFFQICYGPQTYGGLNFFVGFPESINESIFLWVLSYLGIFFWYIIADFVAPLLGDNALVNYISNNTFWIMSTHIAFFKIINYFLLIVNRVSGNMLAISYGFDESQVISNSWYYFSTVDQFNVIYFLGALIGSVCSKKLFDKVIGIFREKVNVKNNIFTI